MANQGRQVAEHQANSKYDDFIQGMKLDHMQREQNMAVKDPDAQYKHLAFATMLEQEGKAIMDRPGKSAPDKLEWTYINDTFSRWYLRELEKDAKRDPRPVNPADFKPKKPFQMPAEDEHFLTKPEREAAFFEEQKLFLENKKEQQERTQLFYVLEQFFENARTKPDPNSEA